MKRIAVTSERRVSILNTSRLPERKLCTRMESMYCKDV
jgi:hypothetical protein